MNRITTRMTVIAAALGLLAIGVGGGYWLGHSRQASSDASTARKKQDNGVASQQVLYWYDPMVPDQHFEKPGKSPFMDMQLVPNTPATWRRAAFALIRGCNRTSASARLL